MLSSSLNRCRRERVVAVRAANTCYSDGVVTVRELLDSSSCNEGRLKRPRRSAAKCSQKDLEISINSTDDIYKLKLLVGSNNARNQLRATLTRLYFIVSGRTSSLIFSHRLCRYSRNGTSLLHAWSSSTTTFSWQTMPHCMNAAFLSKLLYTQKWPPSLPKQKMILSPSLTSIYLHQRNAKPVFAEVLSSRFANQIELKNSN